LASGQKNYYQEKLKMDEYLKEALGIVKAQASVRAMTEEEIASMLDALVGKFKKLGYAEQTDEGLPETTANADNKKSIKENSIVCLECGKSFKILSRRHLASHGLDPASYREKFGLKPKTSLIAKGLQRERRNKMKDMKLWERRKKNNSTPE
jgi:predicted transcriptional regulator